MEEEKVNSLSVDLDNQPEEVRLKVLEYKLKEKTDNRQFDHDNRWRSCCGMVLDRRLVMYSTQMTMIGLTMMFCVRQLTILDTCNDQQSYIGLLTLLLGLVIPSPSTK
jgi:hypothetical protein